MEKPFILGNKTHLWQICFWGLCVLVAYLTLTPSPIQLVEINQIDKFYHACAFMALSAAFRLAYPIFSSRLLVVELSGFGAAIEIFQYFIPNRGCSFTDWLADVIGILLGLIMTKTWQKLTQNCLSTIEQISK